jgi:hypothetical protein
MPHDFAEVLNPCSLGYSQDAEPKQLAFLSALGITLGIFFICVTTMIL